MPLIKVRGVKAYVSKGQVYAYHRATSTCLKSLYGSHDFFAELKAIEDKHEAAPKEAKSGYVGRHRGPVSHRRLANAQTPDAQRLRGNFQLAGATRCHAARLAGRGASC